MEYKIREKLFGANKASAIGTSLTLNDTVKYPINKLTIDGVCEQETTTGKNLLKIEKQTKVANGITTISNEDCSLTSNGTTTNYYYELTNDIICEYPSGTYTFSISKPLSHGLTLRFYFENSNNNYKIPIGSKSVNFTTTEKCNKYRIYAEGNLQIGTIINETIYPQLEEGSTATEWEKYTGGQPSPSPDFPQNISVLTGNLKLTSCGKNLFDYVNNLKASSEGLTSVINEDGSITTTGKPSADYRTVVNSIDITNILEDGQTYTISQANVSDKLYMQVYAKKADGTSTYYYILNKLSQQIKVDKSIYVSYKLTISTGLSKNWGDTSSTITNKYMLCKGTDTADTSFEPYQSSSLNITIPENEFVGKLDDTNKDTLKIVYKEDGHYHLILNKMIGKLVLNDYTNISTYIFNSMNGIQFKNVLTEKHDCAKGLSNYSSIVGKRYVENTIWIGVNSKDVFWLGILDLLNISTIDEFKNWLLNNTVIVYYLLKTPYEVDLGIVDTLLSYDEITNVFSDSDLYPVINVKYYNGSLDISNYEFSIKEV